MSCTSQEKLVARVEQNATTRYGLGLRSKMMVGSPCSRRVPEVLAADLVSILAGLAKQR